MQRATTESKAPTQNTAVARSHLISPFLPGSRATMHFDAFHLHLQREPRPLQAKPKKELASALAPARARPRLRPLAADALKIPNFRATLAMFWAGSPSNADSAASSAVCTSERRRTSLFSTKQVPCSSRFPPDTFVISLTRPPTTNRATAGSLAKHSRSRLVWDPEDLLRTPSTVARLGRSSTSPVPGSPSIDPSHRPIASAAPIHPSRLRGLGPELGAPRPRSFTHSSSSSFSSSPPALPRIRPTFSNPDRGPAPNGRIAPRSPPARGRPTASQPRSHRQSLPPPGPYRPSSRRNRPLPSLPAHCRRARRPRRLPRRQLCLVAGSLLPRRRRRGPQRCRRRFHSLRPGRLVGQRRHPCPLHRHERQLHGDPGTARRRGTVRRLGLQRLRQL